MTFPSDKERMEDEYEFTGGSDYSSAEMGNVEGPEQGHEADPNLNTPSGSPDEPLGMSTAMRKMITYTGIGVATVIVAIYLGYREKAPKDDIQAVQQAPVGTAIPKPVVQTAQPVVSPMPSELSQQNERLGALAQEVKSNATTVENLSIRVQTLESSITKLDDSIKSLDEKMKPVAQPPAVVMKHHAAAPKPVAKAPVIRKYFGLKAVVPGRAWLQTKSGQTMSVSVGDEISGLGRVRSIDEQAGIVELNSGSTIGYGPGDF